MIKKIILLLFVCYISNGHCGITVIGTRFLIDDNIPHLNIQIDNDNESDYLIKSGLDDKDFIISPPLFLLPKNSSNVITIIPKEKKHYNRDKLMSLVLTAIPKSALNNDANSVSLAVRNHFKVIYRHAELQSHDFNKIEMVAKDNNCIINNNSNFVFTISLSNNQHETNKRIINLPPGEGFTIEDKNLTSSCEYWINFHNEYNDIIKTIKLTNK